jgi:hypothetical protein
MKSDTGEFRPIRRLKHVGFPSHRYRIDLRLKRQEGQERHHAVSRQMVKRTADFHFEA